jgi:DNA-binding PadR family transcriptional regulator
MSKKENKIDRLLRAVERTGRGYNSHRGYQMYHPLLKRGYLKRSFAPSNGGRKTVTYLLLTEKGLSRLAAITDPGTKNDFTWTPARCGHLRAREVWDRES